MHTATVPGMGSHDIVDARVLEVVKNLWFDVP